MGAGSRLFRSGVNIYERVEHFCIAWVKEEAANRELFGENPFGLGGGETAAWA